MPRNTTRAVDLMAQDVKKAIAGLPVPAQLAEPRALPIYETVPPGHVLWEVRGEKHAPHLMPEDWVVIDTTARTIVFGELFLVLQSAGPVLWQVCPDPYVKTDRCAWLRPLNNKPPHLRDAGERIYMSDGPTSVDYLTDEILGQVVGLFISPRKFVDRLDAQWKARRAAETRPAPPTIDGRAGR